MVTGARGRLDWRASCALATLTPLVGEGHTQDSGVRTQWGEGGIGARRLEAAPRDVVLRLGYR